MQIGDMNVPNAIINLEVQVGVLNRIIEHMANNHGSAPSASQVTTYRAASQKEVVSRYPNMGITFNG